MRDASEARFFSLPPISSQKKIAKNLHRSKKHPIFASAIYNNGVTIPESDGQTLGKIEKLGLFLLQFS